MVINLNHCQEINDTHGREAVDRVLREVARYLGECLRDSDTAARLGSDEFGVLLPDTDLPHAILPLHRLCRSWIEPLRWMGPACNSPPVLVLRSILRTVNRPRFCCNVRM